MHQRSESLWAAAGETTTLSGVRRGRLLVLLSALLIGGGVTVALTQALGDTPTRNTACGKVSGNPSQLKVVGARMQGTDGSAFIPYGISVISGPETTNWALSEKAVLAQIIASKRYWNANSVRIQVSQSLLFKNPTRRHTYNVPFAASVNRLVCAALRQGQVVILNDNSIFTGARKGPTELTRRFWRFMAKRYGNNLPIIFDLYNEPQVTRDQRTQEFFTPEKAWDLWRDGGSAGRGQRYLGMQDLVDTIRNKMHARNVIWAEQPYYFTLSHTRLDLLATHLLKGGDVVYAFHKLAMNHDDVSSKAVQTLSKQGVPLVTSEWTQFAATDRPWMCQPDSYKLVPGYLDYLRQYKIGLIAWSLQPGVLVRGIPGVDTVHDGNDYRYTHNPEDLAQPSEMQSDYGCSERARGQGAGKLVKDYFARYGVRASTSLFPRFHA
jgi:hypothetical protein